MSSGSGLKLYDLRFQSSVLFQRDWGMGYGDSYTIQFFIPWEAPKNKLGFKDMEENDKIMGSEIAVMFGLGNSKRKLIGKGNIWNPNSKT